MTVSSADIDHCILVLEALVADRGGLAAIDVERQNSDGLGFSGL